MANPIVDNVADARTRNGQIAETIGKNGVEAADADCRRIANLTTAVFTAAFEPARNRIETLRTTARN